MSTNTFYSTQNSHYEIDLDNMRYRRFPNESTWQQPPERRNPQDSPRRVDNVWIDLKAEPEVVVINGKERLHIPAGDSVHGILTSPLKKKP